jgi:hypothetical protein
VDDPVDEQVGTGQVGIGRIGIGRIGVEVGCGNRAVRGCPRNLPELRPAQ